MKRIIDGKTYSTETAECVASWHNSYYPNDFHYCEESLYKTKRGAWFLAGEGGPMSHYAQPVAGGTGGGAGLRVLTEDEAMQWLESHNFTDELEEYFSDRPEEA